MGRHFARSGSPAVAGPGRQIPGLDGIRGLAVVGVVAFHLGFRWARGGYLGVDTFLVLSGYLITSGLLGEHRKRGRIHLGAFWARRARRLTPALLAVIAACAIYAATTALPDEAQSLRYDALASLGFVSNWRYVLSSQGYFGQSAAPSLLRHTWSLGVEAQLYLVWPLIVVAVVGRRGHRALAFVAAGLAAASVAWGVALTPAHGDISRAYYGTDTRAAAFLAGAAIAGWLSGRGPVKRGTGRALTVLALAGLGASTLLWATLGGSSPWLFRGGLAGAALATAAVIAAVVCLPVGRLARSLSLPPVRLLGRVSYGIYLWHWPLILWLDHRRTGLSGASLLMLRLGAIAFATALSWLVIERPVLGLSRVRMPRRWQPALGALACIALVVAVVLPVSAPAQIRPAAAAALVDPPSPSSAESPPTTAPPTLHVVVLGDSVAVTLGNVLKPFASDYHFALDNGAIVGCGVALGTALRTQGDVAQIPAHCEGWERDWQGWIDSARPDAVLILLGRWEVLDRELNGRWQHIGQPDFDAYLAAQLDRSLTIAGSGGAAVVVCTAPYYAGQERPGGGAWPENDPARVDRFNALLREAIARHPGVQAYDLNAATAPGGHFASALDGVAVRSSDGVHFGPGSGAFLSPRLFPIVRDAVDRSGRDPGPAGTTQ